MNIILRIHANVGNTFFHHSVRVLPHSLLSSVRYDCNMNHIYWLDFLIFPSFEGSSWWQQVQTGCREHGDRGLQAGRSLHNIHWHQQGTKAINLFIYQCIKLGNEFFCAKRLLQPPKLKSFFFRGNVAGIPRKNFVILMGLPTFYLDSWNYLRKINKYRKDKFHL